jgi:predicted DNA-binding transcriptional regulator AlpA
MGTRLKKGVRLLEEVTGDGDLVQHQHEYILSIRLTLNKGDVLSPPPLSFYLDGNQKQHDDGFFDHRTRIDRECLIPGLFYAVEGMRIGGYRKVAISPHLAYGERGVPDKIPANAKLIAEIRVLREMDAGEPWGQRPTTPDGKMLTQDELCERYQVKRVTLWQWRRAGRLPAPTVVGTKVRWELSTIERWEADDRPHVSPCLDETKEQRDQACVRLGQRASESQTEGEDDQTESSTSRQAELQQMSSEIDGLNETAFKLELELALLIDEAGQWSGPPLEHLLKGGEAARRESRDLANVLDKVLADPTC